MSAVRAARRGVRASSTCWSKGAHCARLRRQDREPAGALRRGSARALNLTTRRLSLRWPGDAADAGRRAMAIMAALGYRAAPVRPGPAAAPTTTARADAAALPGGGRLRRRQRHAAVGRRSGPATPRHGGDPRPCSTGCPRADRPAGDRLCRAAVLPLGLARAAPRPHQHGRADLDRRDPGHWHVSLYETVRSAASTPISTAPITLLFFLLIGRYLDQPRARPARAARRERLLALARRSATRASLPDGTQPAASGR